MAESVEERLARALTNECITYWFDSNVERALKLSGLALYDPATDIMVPRALWCGADKPGRERPSEVEPSERRTKSGPCSMFFPPEWWMHAYRCGTCGHWFHKACLADHIAKTGDEVIPRVGMGHEQYGALLYDPTTHALVERPVDPEALARFDALAENHLRKRGGSDGG